jgi:hypothetical protein
VPLTNEERRMLGYPELSSSPSSTTTTSLSGGSSSTGTSGLGGYALEYMKALQKGLSDTVAHRVATTTIGGSGMTPQELSRILEGGAKSDSSVFSPTGYVVSSQQSGWLNDFINSLKPKQPVINNEIYDLMNKLKGFDYNKIINSVLSGIPKPPEPPPKLTIDEAQARARAALSPLYQQYAREALSKVNKDLIRRGLFGQPASRGVTTEAIAKIGSEEAGAIGRMVNDLINKSAEEARLAEQLGLQRYQTEINKALGALSQASQMEQAQRNQLMGLLALLHNIQSSEKQFGLQEKGLDLQGRELGIKERGTQLEEDKFKWSKETHGDKLSRDKFNDLIELLSTTGTISTKEQADLFGLPVGWKIPGFGVKNTGGSGSKADETYNAIVQGINQRLSKKPSPEQISAEIRGIQFYMAAGLISPERGQKLIDYLNSLNSGSGEPSNIGTLRSFGLGDSSSWSGAFDELTPNLASPLVRFLVNREQSGKPWWRLW